jgi:Prohead core protein protease.
MGVEMKMKLITESRFDVAWKAVDEDGKNLYIEGIFSSAEIMNENGRRYRKNILEREIDKMQDSIKNRCAWGS